MQIILIDYGICIQTQWRSQDFLSRGGGAALLRHMKLNFLRGVSTFASGGPLLATPLFAYFIIYSDIEIRN